jgi:hypothetical protein
MRPITPLLQIAHFGFESPHARVAYFKPSQLFGVFAQQDALALNQVGHYEFESLEVVSGRIDKFRPRLCGDLRFLLSILGCLPRSS